MSCTSTRVHASHVKNVCVCVCVQMRSFMFIAQRKNESLKWNNWELGARATPGAMQLKQKSNEVTVLGRALS
jgi:hypothetical protein